MRRRFAMVLQPSCSVRRELNHATHLPCVFELRLWEPMSLLSAAGKIRCDWRLQSLLVSVPIDNQVYHTRISICLKHTMHSPYLQSFRSKLQASQKLAMALNQDRQGQSVWMVKFQFQLWAG